MEKEKKPIQEQVRDDVTMLKKINMLKNVWPNLKGTMTPTNKAAKKWVRKLPR